MSNTSTPLIDDPVVKDVEEDLRPEKRSRKFLWKIIVCVAILIILFVIVYTMRSPPAVLIEETTVLATLIENFSCTECAGVDFFLQQMEDQGVDLEILHLSVENATDIITKHDITHVPVVIFSNNLKKYSNIHTVWHNYGTIANSGEYVFRYVNPLFTDLDGTIRGYLDVTYITDDSCTACYDVNIHKEVFEQSGLHVRTEKIVDINSPLGFTLQRKYDLQYVPTIIISKELSVYPRRLLRWDRVGSIEDDGSYVFRNLNVMEGVVYKDLETGQLLDSTEK
jgi:hypothetical protein